MSLVLVANEIHPQYRLIVASNRDEYHRRDSAVAAPWEDAPRILAGRDLEAGGTWLGVTRDGRFAAITGYRAPKSERPGLRSRGLIVSDFLDDDNDAMSTLRSLCERPREHNPFSVLMYDGRVLGWCSNRIRGARALGAGIYGQSNHLLDTPWHKVTSGKCALESVLASATVRARDLLDLLDARAPAPDAHLPHTGVGEDCERWLSSRFVVGQTFGTRSSSVLLISRSGEVEFVERSFDALGVEVATTRFTFCIEQVGRAAPRPGAHRPVSDSGDGALGMTT